MRVAINGWFWVSPYTGSGQYVRRLIAHLRLVAPELELTLIVPKGPIEDMPDGVRVIETGGGRGNLAKVWFEQRRVPAAAARAQADLLFVPYWGAPLSSPVPLVVSILDAIPLALPEYRHGLLQHAYVSLQTAAARGATQVITISEAAKTDLVRLIGLPAERVHVTSLAADAAFHPRMGAERDAEVRVRFDLPERFVLYLGGFDRRKNLRQLLEAYAYVTKAEGDEVPLVIAGREPVWGEPMFPDARALAHDLGIEHAVRWIGPVEEAAKPSLYRLADVFVYPSLYEGFGLPPLEAMASGTPVVACQIPVMEEVCGDGAYLTPPGDPRKMAGAILALLGQRDLYETQVTRGLSRATRFQWRKTARETAEAWKRVTSYE